MAMSVAQPKRLDVLGASALLVAGAALAGSVVLLRPASAGPSTSAAVGTPGVSTVSVQDQWYFDQEPGARTVQRPALPSSAVKDRWYADMTSTAVNPAAISSARDRWYLDGR
jgi:hypothetical protein